MRLRASVPLALLGLVELACTDRQRGHESKNEVSPAYSTATLLQASRGGDKLAEEDKPKHPKYVPAFRYARDIIGGLNSWLVGWIGWNMVLDTPYRQWW